MNNIFLKHFIVKHEFCILIIKITSIGELILKIQNLLMIISLFYWSFGLQAFSYPIYFIIQLVFITLAIYLYKR